MKKTDRKLVSRRSLKKGFALERVINAGGMPYSLILDIKGFEYASAPTEEESELLKWWDNYAEPVLG